MSLSVISRRRIRAIVTMSLRWLTRTMCQIASKSGPFSLARATPSEGAKTGVAEPHIAEQSMPVRLRQQKLWHHRALDHRRINSLGPQRRAGSSTV